MKPCLRTPGRVSGGAPILLEFLPGATGPDELHGGCYHKHGTDSFRSMPFNTASSQAQLMMSLLLRGVFAQVEWGTVLPTDTTMEGKFLTRAESPAVED
jgi:hypothetical protein